MRTASVRSMIALAAKDNLLLHQMDVTTAFLNGTLEEEVYMKQPEGFATKGKEHLVCKLKKSIFGLKQLRTSSLISIQPSEEKVAAI